ncbi:MAG: tail fiber protein, partial [Sphingomonadaceae bacterium]|nr:tail fiber protein [Sphingomonadaceae bacterium]
MAEQLFYLPFRPAISASGLVVPGAQLFFYSTGTTTKLPVYADADLTTELPNPVQANAAGVWPSIYLNDSLIYRVVLKDAD